MHSSLYPKPRIAIITGGTLPVPNTEGGAVEALDMNLIQENEAQADCHLTVFSIFTHAAFQRAGKLKLNNTDFEFIRIPLVVRLLDKISYTSAKLFHRQNLMGYRYIFQRLWFLKKVSQILSKSTTVYDRIIIENSAASFHIFKNKKNSILYKDRVYFHLHNEVFHTFGCSKQLHEVKKVLGVSNYITNSFNNFLCRTTGEGLSEDQKARWFNGIDIRKFNSQTAIAHGKQLRKELGISANDIVYMFAGRLTKEKGALELLQAFKYVVKEIPNSKLVVAGGVFFNTDIQSPFEQSLYELANDPYVKDKIIFTGYINYEAMPSYYSMADICVLPSIWKEPAGLTIMESIAAEKPLITTRTGGIPEYVNDDCAVLLDIDNDLIKNLSERMLYLAKHPQKRLEMARASAKRKKEFSLQKFYQNFRKLLDV